MHARRSIVLALILLSSLPAAALAQTEPVQFMLSGTIEDADGAPLDRAQIVVHRTDTGEVLARRVFTGPDGSFSTSFQAEVVPNVGLGDPPPGAGPQFDGFWMGEMWPNPYVPGEGRALSVPFAAPSRVQERPALEIYDARGRRIHDAELMASGVYFYRLRFEERVTDARKLLLLGPGRIQPELQRVAGPTKGFDAPASAGRRAEGELAVEIDVVKDGYVTGLVSSRLDSRRDNQIVATLQTAPVPTAQMQVGGTLVAGEAVLFDGIGSSDPDGQVLTYSWDFGDGQRGGTELVAHVFSSAGTYDVQLTVSTRYGATATTSQSVEVVAAAPAASNGASALGTVRDAIGNLLAGVLVSEVGGSASGTTDASGTVLLTGLPTGIPVTLRFDKDGYTEQLVRLILPANTTDAEFAAALRKQRAALPVEAIEDGAELTGEDGVKVELPADALLLPDGSAASGAADVRLTPVDVGSEIEAGAFPGAYEGVLNTGERKLLLSYGVAEFVIEQGGQHLQLAPGSVAQVEIPVYTPGAAVDDVIPLWSVDPTTGLWTEEGTGTVVASGDSPTGLALRAQVTHFSWWNADIADDPYTIIPECLIKDQNGLPTLQIPAGGSCYLEGRIVSSNGPTSRPTVTLPPGGGIPLVLPADTDVQLTASAVNGTKRGSAVVNGPAGGTGTVTIALDDPGGAAGAIDLPADLEATIDPAGEVDSYTFDAVAGQSFNVFVEQSGGSTLTGQVTLFLPDGTEAASSAFGSSPALITWEATGSGTYRIEVDGLTNEPGAYHLKVSYAEVFDLALPSVVDDDITPGEARIFYFPATAGDWFSVNYLRREPVGFGRVGTLKIESPSGASLYDLNFSAIGLDTGVFQATETGDYRIELTSRDIEAAYSLFVRDVPEILHGGVAVGSAEERSTRYFRFAAAANDFVHATYDKVVNFGGNMSIVDTDNQNVDGSWIYQVDAGTPLTPITTAGDYFLQLTASHTQVRTTRDFRVSLTDVAPPEPLGFDTAGRAQVNGADISVFGEIKLYEFDAGSGSGVALQLDAGDVTTLGDAATVRMYTVGSGDWTAPDQQTTADFNVLNSGVASLGILEFTGYTLPQASTYIIAVSAPAPQEGAFDLTVDRVAPAASISVDDDLLDCPAAVTRSHIAAVLAAQPGTAITLCPGTYEAVVPVSLGQTGLEFTGSSAAEVTVRSLVRGFAIYGPLTPARIAGLTVECADPGNSSAIYLGTAVGTVLEDLVVRGTVASPPIDHGIELGSGSDGCTIRRVRAETTLRAFDGYADNSLIEDCEIVGGYGLVELQGDRITVQNNVWTCDQLGEALSIDNGAGHQVLGNQVTFTTPDIGANLGTFAMHVEDADAGASLPATVIRGNRITTNEAGFELRLDQTGSSILCEQNVVEMTGRGQTALEILPQRDAGADATIRNNVFSGLANYEGLHLRWADWYGSLGLYNNTMRTDQSQIVQATYPTVRIDLRSGSTFTGALPVQFSNNVLQGRGAGVALTIPAGTTIDADYNLLDAYPTFYDTGATATGANDILGQDPQFTGALLELQPGSPGVDSGASPAEVAAVPTVDLDGTARPQGAGYDRGAHEQ